MLCSVTEDACTVQQELVKRRSSLLLKYIRKDTAKFELEALYAVQLIVHRHGHPYGLYTHLNTHCTQTDTSIWFVHTLYTRSTHMLYCIFTDGKLSNAELTCMSTTI